MRIDPERGRWAEALLAGVATLTTAWPLTGLLRENVWVDEAVLLVLLIAVLGALLRTLDLGPSLVVLGQLLAGTTGLLLLYLPETLRWGVVPTGATWEGALVLLRESGTVLQTYAAPAPATLGVQFLVVALLMLTALSVDSIAVGAASPATAGIPLAAAFLVSVSNTGEAMEAYYFIAVAIAWLAMIAQQGDRSIREWASADRREAVGSHDVSVGPRSHRTLARLLGVATVALALVGASLLPHLPPTFFAEGLARNPDARTVGGGDAEVSFTETMDPTQDLLSRSQEPVLRYRTDATQLVPLRVTATAEYEDGRWLPPDYEATTEATTDRFVEVPPFPDRPDLTVRERQVEVVDNSLGAPHLAIPSTRTAVELDVPWQYDPVSEALRVRDRPDAYQSSYLELGRAATLPEDIGAPEGSPASGAQTAGSVPQEYLEVDPLAQPAVADLLEQVVPDDAVNQLDVGSAIQNHLRSGEYLYSLTLARGLDTASDPISHFVQTKQGYCVQFATTMVMMAREAGIPARMAIGFLPGTNQPDGTREVLASDAHTWPELFITGLGWTRFEPTPGIQTGAAPPYTQTQQDVEAEQIPMLSPSPTAAPPPPTPAGGASDAGWWDRMRDLAPEIGTAVLVLVALALLMTLLPWAGRRYREAAARGAKTPQEQIEGQWTWMTRSLEDLGIDQPPPRSPREMQGHYREHTHLDRRSGEALGRATATLERVRYAPAADDPQQVEQMLQDVRTVVDTVQERLPWNIRTHSRLLPRSGWHYMRELLRR